MTDDTMPFLDALLKRGGGDFIKGPVTAKLCKMAIWFRVSGDPVQRPAVMRVEERGMKRLWSADELDECWTLSPGDLAFIADNADAGRLGLACQLAFWRSQGRFPTRKWISLRP